MIDDETIDDETIDDESAEVTEAPTPAPAAVEAADGDEPDAQEPLRVAQARLLEAQRVFFATPHAQNTRPDLADAVEQAKDDVRAAMAAAGHEPA